MEEFVPSINMNKKEWYKCFIVW